MGIHSVDRDSSGVSQPPNQPDDLALHKVLDSLSLRCVECNAVYPGFETTPRYRCACGGVLDVEMPFSLPAQRMPLPNFAAKAESDLTPLAGAPWRQLFDEGAAMPPIWPLST